MLNHYEIFIIHGWEDSEKYNHLISMLSSQESFLFTNNSVPKNDDLYLGGFFPDLKIKKLLKEKIKKSQVVLIILIANLHNRKWIEFELTLAKKYSKPIVGIYPPNHNCNYDTDKNINQVVNWNVNSVIESIISSI